MKNILKSEEYDIIAPKFKLAFGLILEICRILKDTDSWKIKFTGIGCNDIHEILSKHTR